MFLARFVRAALDSPHPTNNSEGDVQMGNRSGATVRRWATTLLVAGMGVVGSASATLIDRGPDLVFDNVLNITWTRQAGDGVLRNWDDSVAWANNLVVAGFDDWRLPWASVSAGAGPVTTVVNCATATEVACRDNEMGHLFYYDLGGTFPQDLTGDQTAVGGQVLTGIEDRYWSGTRSFVRASDGVSDVWDFRFQIGDTVSAAEFSLLSAWGLHAGDVAGTQEPGSTVPEPASLLLFGLGALGLGWSRRSGRRR
jgi:hypothetical protein